MKRILILLLPILIVYSCSDKDENDLAEINIRLSNVSTFNFQNIVVNTSSDEMSFESLNPGQKTNFQTVKIAYGYAFIELEINGETYTIQPIDYVDLPLENGNYTYLIDANDSRERFSKLSMTLKEE